MTLPNAERAIVDIRKLHDYCLNPLHDEGQHKARLFAATLGMTADDAEGLRDLLLEAITTHEAHPGRRDTYGQRYTVDCQVVWHKTSEPRFGVDGLSNIIQTFQD